MGGPCACGRSVVPRLAVARPSPAARVFLCRAQKASGSVEAGDKKRRAPKSTVPKPEGPPAWLVQGPYDVAEMKESLQGLEGRALDEDVETRRKSRVEVGRDAALKGDEHLRRIDQICFGGKMRDFMDGKRSGVIIDRGALGEGRVAWYQVTVRGACKRVMESVEISIKALPSATGTPRYCRCWLPEKRFSYFNPRTERDSTRIARWNEGMAFFLEVAMDSAVYDVLMANPLVMGIQDREEYCGETFPRPLSDEYMAGVHEWEQTADRKQETQWQYELMGRGKDTMRAPGRGRGGRGRGRGRGTRDIFAPEVAYERNEGNIDWYRRTGQSRDGGRDRGKWWGDEAEDGGGDDWFQGQ